MTDILQTAMNAFVNGRIKEAERTCRAILKRQPAAHAALHLLAMTEKRRGKFKQAIRTFNKALRLAPSTPMYWNNLGETYREMGDVDKAIKSYQRAIKHRPEYAEAYSNWGAALMMKGDHLQAEKQLVRATEINPDLVNAIYNLGVLYIDTDSPELARKALERTLGIDPDNDDALVNLAYLDKEAGQLDRAQAHYLHAIAINPSHFDAHLNLADLLYEKQQYDEAIEHFCKATDIDRRSGPAILGLANATLMSGDHDGVMRIAERYRKTIGEDSQLHVLLAKTRLFAGELAKAEAQARRCLALDPESVTAWEVIVQARRFDDRGEDLRNMIELYENPGLTLKQRTMLAFTLAGSLDATGDYSAAFGYLEQGNRFRMEASGQDTDDLDTIRESAARLESLFTPDFMQTHSGQGCEDDTPIFIVGLPRSGKTVTEALLCRHPQVAVGGELKQFGASVTALLKGERLGMYPDSAAALNSSILKAVGKKYVGELRKRFKSEKHVTNTLPGNAFRLGMIHLCLPRARVVWVDRGMRDTCFEIYRNNFPEGHGYSNEPGTVGEYAGRFNSLMAYWDQLLPGLIYKLKFEEMIADPETQLRGLLDFCGLEWDEACLHESRIEQGESWAASMPTPENAIGVWKPYEKHLAPLFEALEKQQ
jgi:tetratricopeptide (TPR) repeat protein